MTIVFKHADLLRITGVTASQLDYWFRLGLIKPHKDATASGDHREFSIVNVIEVAAAVWLATLGMSTDSMRQILALQRKTMERVPPEHRALQVWMQYVHMVRAGARWIGMTDEPGFQAWERDVALTIRRFEKRRSGITESRLLDLVIAQRAALLTDGRYRVTE